MKCSKEFKIAKYEFKADITLNEIIKSDGYLNDMEKSLKASILEKIQQLERELTDFSLKQIQFESAFYDHFAEIRRKIDLQREELKSKIDELALAMIEHAKATEKELLQQLNEKYSQIKLASLQELSKTAHDEFRKQNLTLESINKLKMEQEKKIGQVKSIVDDINCIKEDIESYEFQVRFYGK